MRVFYGSCSKCLFCYSVNDRMPMYCPECGEHLYCDTVLVTNHEQYAKLSSQVKHLTVRLSNSPINTDE